MTSKRYENNEIGFIHAFLGLIFLPFATIEKLFIAPKPLYPIFILIIFLATLLLPVIASSQIHGTNMFDPKQVASLILVFILTLLYFVFIESIFLSIFGVGTSISGLVNCVCYSLPAVIAIIWMMYGINYAASGNLSLVTFMATGLFDKQDPFLKFVPIVINIAILIAFCVFFRGLKLMSNLFNTNAIILTLFSIIPFHLALMLAVFSANFINPGTTQSFIQLLYTPGDILG